MNVEFKYAVLTYSTDLTDPSVSSTPLAVIAVGDLSDTQGFVFVGVSHDRIDPSKDPFGVVRELPRFLDARIQEGLKESRAADLLAWLQPKLRQSLSLCAPRSTSMESEPDQFLVHLVALYHSVVPAMRDGAETTTPRSLPTLRFEPVSQSA